MRPNGRVEMPGLELSVALRGDCAILGQVDSRSMSCTAQVNFRRLLRRILLVLLLAAFPLFLDACAKRESVAEHEAEIERQQQRLKAEYQAEEEERLAQRRAELDAREKALAAQESSFATMAANPPESLPPAPDANEGYGANEYTAVDSYSTYPLSYSYYPEQDGAVTPNEPLFAPEPSFFPSEPPLISILNQNAQVVYLQQRNRHRPGRNHHRPGPPPRPASGAIGGGYQVILRSNAHAGGRPTMSLRVPQSVAPRPVPNRHPTTTRVAQGPRRELPAKP